MIARRDIDSLTVDLAGNWRLYTNRLPAGARALGVVNSRGASGALAQTTAGVYVRVNAGALASLPQRKVGQAIEQKRTGSGGPGRGQGAKAADGVTNVARYNVTLDAASEAVARQIGGGDRSLGIRKALGRAHAEWVREKAGESLADSRPNISHQQVMLDAQTLITVSAAQTRSFTAGDSGVPLEPASLI